jgi:hypothetical protein
MITQQCLAVPFKVHDSLDRPRIQIVRFGPKVFDKGIETHIIERVSVRIYSPAKTVVDLFRHAQRQKVFSTVQQQV